MACGDDMKTQLSRYVDGELSPEERARVDEHVSACASCRELLQIFQKNESILSNALSTESFGNTVIESVMSELKREGPPIEASPVDEEAAGWFRLRPALQLAAAALLVIGLVVVLSGSYNRDLEKTSLQVRNLSTQVQTLSELLSKSSVDYEKTIAQLRLDQAHRGAREKDIILARISPEHLIVKASFDLKQYTAFVLYRRNEGNRNEEFKAVSGKRRLDTPEYIDTDVKPGQGYVYKFRAYRSAREDEFVESFPYTMRVPRELDADRAIRVQCVDVGATFKQAKFLLQRIVDGRTVTAEFAIKPGERLGEVRDVAGVGKVDFRTNLTLDRLGDGDQTMTVRYTTAVLDASGKPVIVEWKDGTEEVKTVQEERVLSIRQNLRAFFCSSGAATADVELWKGSFIQVRAQD
jgi:hypothetical protein